LLRWTEDAGGHPLAGHGDEGRAQATTASYDSELWQGDLQIRQVRGVVLLLAGRGGEGKKKSTSVLCRSGALKKSDELNHACGILADAILCRQGGMSTTSDAEANLRITRWSTTPLRHQVICPWWLGGGQRRWFFVGRGHSSILVLFLGGDAWRTPARSGGDALGFDCTLSFSVGCFL
jgi:hypothetical protein